MSTATFSDTNASAHRMATDLAVAMINKSTESTFDVQQLMKDCYQAVTHARMPAVEPEPKREALTPAQIRGSIKQDFLVCFEDNKRFKSLKRHLRTHYNLSPAQYREKWGLPADYPMVAPGYSATRSRLAKENKLGHKS